MGTGRARDSERGSSPYARRSGQGGRWWPVPWVSAAAALACAAIWFQEAPHRQGQVLASLATAVATLLLLLLWLLFFSRLRWRIRLGVLGAFVVAGVVAVLSLRVRGVSGDLVPVLEWRWASGPRTAPLPRPAADRPVDAEPSWLDYPQFLGQLRDGSVHGVRLARDWTAQPPRELWRRPVGEGWSGFAVVGDRAVTLEQAGPQELVTCYDAKTGTPRWSHADPARFEDPMAGAGPRATPAIHEGRVYSLGGTGILNALDLATGCLLWTKNILEDNGAALPRYGVSASPLVADGWVIIAAGGTDGRSLVAYDRETGRRVWAAGTDPPAYSSPMVAELAGVRQVLILNGEKLAAHDLRDGQLLWSHLWPPGTENVSQPVVLPENSVFLSTGYGVGGKLLGLHHAPDGSWKVELQWETQGLKAKFTNVVYRDGHLYGLDDGILVCLDAATGSRRWKAGRYGHGQVLLVGDLLLVMSENGDVVLVAADPENHRELARLPALSGKTWNHPAMAGRYLFVRNDREAAAYELPVAR